MGNRSIGLRAVPTAGRLLLLSLLAATLGWARTPWPHRVVVSTRAGPCRSRDRRRALRGRLRAAGVAGGAPAGFRRDRVLARRLRREPGSRRYGPGRLGAGTSWLIVRPSRRTRPGPARPGSWPAGDRRGVPRPAAEGTRRGRRAGGAGGRSTGPLHRPHPGDRAADRAAPGLTARPAGPVATALAARYPTVPPAGGPRGSRPHGRRGAPTMTASGSDGPTWRSGPGNSRRPRDGSRSARPAGPTTRTSGGPGWPGPLPPAAPTRPCGP